MDGQRNFRRRTRPGWTRPSENEPVPIKRLRGLDEFIKPKFLGRMARVERRRRLIWYAMLAGAIAVGALIGLVLT
jgi:hypothetical protein